MSEIEILKANLQAAVASITNPAYIQELIEHADSLKSPRMATEDEERRIALGMADVRAGRVLSWEQYLAATEQDRKEREAKMHKAR